MASPGGENWGADATRSAASPKLGMRSAGKARAGLGECGDSDGDDEDSGSGLPRSVFGVPLARASVGITAIPASNTSEGWIREKIYSEVDLRVKVQCTGR